MLQRTLSSSSSSSPRLSKASKKHRHVHPGKAISSHSIHLSKKRKERLWKMWRWFLLLLMISSTCISILFYHTLCQVNEMEISSRIKLMDSSSFIHEASIHDFGNHQMSFVPDEMFFIPKLRSRRLLSTTYNATIPEDSYKGYKLSKKVIQIPISSSSSISMDSTTNIQHKKNYYVNSTKSSISSSSLLFFRNVVSLQDPNQIWRKNLQHGRKHNVNGDTRKNDLLSKAEKQRKSILNPLDTMSIYPKKEEDDDNDKNETTKSNNNTRWIDLFHETGQLPFKPSVPFLGVLLDGGRHYFEVEWIKNLIDVLEQLNYNLIHFRLTDDQAFAVLLESHANLAKAAPRSRTKITNHKDVVLDEPKVYRKNELKDLVNYAYQRGIQIMPEINIPGHAGGWAGSIPNLVLPCANFCCEYGYGLPLNITHPKLFPLLKDVINEVFYDIFHTSSFIHLGGDEVNMASPCFDEVNQDMYDYNIFESRLESLLQHQLKIPLSNVVRWEMTGQQNVDKRVDGISHYWFSRHYEKRNLSRNKNVQQHRRRGRQRHATSNGIRQLEETSSPTTSPPTTLYFNNDTSKPYDRHVFVSTGLYFDTNQDSTGWMIYENTRMLINQTNQRPLGIIVGTFELGQDFWMDRNVVGRLLAVAMGAAASVNFTVPHDFGTHYIYYCRMMGWSMKLCRLYGSPIVDEIAYKESWTNWTERWKHDFCNRTTYQEYKREMNNNEQQYYPYGRNHRHSQDNHHQTLILSESSTTFWKHFGEKKLSETGTTTSTSKKKNNHDLIVEHAGIIINLVKHGSIMDRNNNGGKSNVSLLDSLKDILDIVNLLGFNTIQLTLMDDTGMIFNMDNHTNGLLSYNALSTSSSSSSSQQQNNVAARRNVNQHGNQRFTSWTMNSFKQLIDYMNKNNNNKPFYFIPEIAIATRGSGGWFQSGFHLSCPKFLCSSNGGAIDTSKSNMFLSIVSAAIVELYHVFGNTGGGSLKSTSKDDDTTTTTSTIPFIHLGYDERQESLKCFKEATNSDNNSNDYYLSNLNILENKIQKVLQMFHISQNSILRWENNESMLYNKRAGFITHYHYTIPTTKEEEESYFISTNLNLEESNIHHAWDIYQQTRKYVEQSNNLPKGILANIGSSTTTKYIQQVNIKGRLLAFGMALWKKNDDVVYNSKEEFLIAYQKECSSIFGDDNVNCNDGKMNRPVMARKRYERDEKERSKASCDSKTHVQVYTYPKKGVLIP